MRIRLYELNCLKYVEQSLMIAVSGLGLSASLKYVSPV